MKHLVYFNLSIFIAVFFIGQNCSASQELHHQHFIEKHGGDGDAQIISGEFAWRDEGLERLDQDGNNLVTKDGLEKTWLASQQNSDDLQTYNDIEKRQGYGRSIPTGVIVHRDIEYAEVDGESLYLDLYLPGTMDASTPLLVWIHGGGWARGDKALINPVATRLSGEGYAVASINYRLGGVSLHPKQVHDCKGAIRWLRANAHLYGYDATRIGVGGGSAGAHLALLLGLSSGVPELEGDVGGNLEESSQIQAIVNLFGPSALLAYASEKPSFRGKKSFELLRSASPVNYLTKDDPPILMFHGDKDEIVPVSQSRILHWRYWLEGLDSTLYIIEGAGHGGMQYSDPTRYALIKNFFDKHIKEEKGETGKKVDYGAMLKTNASKEIEVEQQQFSSGEQPSKEVDEYYSEEIRDEPNCHREGESALKCQQPAEMHGFHWMIGPKSGLNGSEQDFQRLLNTIERNLTDNPYITGVYIITHWRLIEPEDSQFDLSRLDRVIEVVRKQGRYYKLSINPGIYTPEWVYKAGANAFDTVGSNPDRQELYNNKTKIPIPWDEVFLSHYFQALEKISERYKDDANFRAVAVTVATFMSPEWHLPRSKKDRAQWQELTGFPDKLEQAWKKGIDRYSTLFPNQNLVLEASSYPVGLKAMGDAIVHYGVSKYGGRFAVQINQLSGQFDQIDRPTFQKLIEYRKKYGSKILIGLQNAKGWGSEKARKKQGTMEMTAYNFIQSGADYWELWFHDGKATNTVKRLHDLTIEGMTVGVDKFKENLKKSDKYRP